MTCTCRMQVSAPKNGVNRIKQACTCIFNSNYSKPPLRPNRRLEIDPTKPSTRDFSSTFGCCSTFPRSGRTLTVPRSWRCPELPFMRFLRDFWRWTRLFFRSECFFGSVGLLSLLGDDACAFKLSSEFLFSEKLRKLVSCAMGLDRDVYMFEL